MPFRSCWLLLEPSGIFVALFRWEVCPRFLILSLASLSLEPTLPPCTSTPQYFFRQTDTWWLLLSFLRLLMRRAPFFFPSPSLWKTSSFELQCVTIPLEWSQSQVLFLPDMATFFFLFLNFFFYAQGDAGTCCFRITAREHSLNNSASLDYYI